MTSAANYFVHHLKQNVLLFKYCKCNPYIIILYGSFTTAVSKLNPSFWPVKCEPAAFASLLLWKRKPFRDGTPEGTIAKVCTKVPKVLYCWFAG